MKKISYQLYPLKEVFIPLAYFFVLVILYSILLKTGLSKISTQLKAIRTAEKQVNTLTAKVELLKDLEPTLPSYVNAATLALPEKNPALLAISQLKNIAGQNAIFLEDLKISGGGQASGHSNLAVSFKLSGTFEQIISFIEAMKSSAPIVALSDLEFSKTGGETVYVDVKANFFWAEYPEKISSVDSPLAGLTQKETDTLQELTKLKKPLFSTLSPQSPGTRVNPFVQ